VLTDDAIIFDSQASLRQSPFVAFQPANRRAGFRAADVRNSIASHVDSVLRCQESDRLIIHSNKIRRKARQSAIDQDIRRSLPFNPEEEVHCRSTSGNDQCIEAARQELFDLLILKVRIFLRGRND
jgi:hypothetical protein